MPENILQNIIKKKEIRIAELKKKKPLESIKQHMPDSMNYLDFKETIEENIKNNNISIIAEIKKASPSAGIIIKDYDPIKIAKIYENYNATCLSILTEEDFFHGDLIHLSKIKQQTNLPILCKDFFVDRFQVPLAKSYGADAILIILAGVTDKLANDLYEEALKLNMSVIVEVHTIEEAKRALQFKSALIGINNRNLKTLKIDLDTFERLSKKIPKGIIKICESGLKSNKQLRYFTKIGADGFLIGEYLMASNNLKKKTIEIIKK